MKNRFFITSAWLIALLLLVLHPLSMSAQPLPGINADRNVIFLHGLNDNQNAWARFINRYNSIVERRWINSSNPSYLSAGSLNNIANQLTAIGGTGASSIAICHSLGGVIARDLDNRNPGNFVGGLITIGSPLDGAVVANSVLDGTASTCISNSTSTMLRGPYATLGFTLSPLFTFNANNFTALFLPDAIQFVLLLSNLGSLETMADLQVGGNGIEQAKAIAPTATPKISIWGNENTPTHWNILGTMKKKDVAGIAEATSDFYEVMYWYHIARGAGGWWNAWGWWNFYAAYEWYAGMDWVDNDSERVWNYIVGSSLTGTQCYQETRDFFYYDMTTCDDMLPRQWANCQLIWEPRTITTCIPAYSNGQSDAWIPASSQRGDGSNSWRVASGATSNEVLKREAVGVNHFEELDGTNTVMQGIFRDIFDRTDVRVAPVFQINRR